MTVIITTLVVSFVLAFILGFLLGVFKKVFHVEGNPLEQDIRVALPGANCGACGYPGCDAYAAAVARGEAPPNLCSVGGSSVAASVGKLIGVDSTAIDQVAVLACQGSKELAPVKGFYNGIQSCRAAKLGIGGLKKCSWGCMGFGDCEKVCRFDALHVKEDGLPHVDYRKCTGCGMCVAECPQQLLSTVPLPRKGAVALCSNRNPVKTAVIKDCKTGCIKCGKCERNCPEKAIKLVNGIPVVDYILCTSCGICIADCPTKVLKLLETDVIRTEEVPAK